MKLGAVVSLKELQSNPRLRAEIVEVTYHLHEKCMDIRTDEVQRYVHERVEREWLEQDLLPLLDRQLYLVSECETFLVYRVARVSIPEEEIGIRTAMPASKMALTA